MRSLLLTAASFTVGAVLTFVADHPYILRRAALTSTLNQMVRFLERVPYSVHEADPRVVCWGDSLTAGTGTTLGHDFPTMLQSIFHRPSQNQGVGGETSSQIKVRMLSRAKPNGTEAAVIWAGRNNYDQPDTVVQDVADMVASLAPGSRFVVLGILNADAPGEAKGEEKYVSIKKLNSRLKETYGRRYVEIREILVHRADPRFDIRDIERDIVPSSFRSDFVHLNDAGEAVVTNAIDAAFAEDSW